MENQTKKTSVDALATVGKSVVISSYEVSSPIPAAAEVDAYEKTMPGAAKKIFSWAEKEQNARIEFNKTEQRNAYELNKETLVITKRGQTLAFVLIAASIGVALTCAFLKLQALGIAAFGISGGLGYFLLHKGKSVGK